MRLSTLFATLLGACLLLPGLASAKPPLSEHGYINSQLFVAAVADELRKRCPSVEARMVLVRTRGLALFNYALGQGYSRAEISDYLESKPDNARMKARRDAYMAERGVRRGDAESYCRLARTEMSAGTAIGELLRGD